jgi:hypothetical protein
MFSMLYSLGKPVAWFVLNKYKRELAEAGWLRQLEVMK